MAEIHLTLGSMSSKQKMRLYDSFAQINRAVRSIIYGLDDLKRIGVYDIHRLRTFQGLTRELQSEINTHLLAVVHDVEMQDAYIHGKVRIRRDNYLRG